MFGSGGRRHIVISLDDLMALAIIRKEKVVLVCELAATNVLLSHGIFAHVRNRKLPKSFFPGAQVVCD